MEDRVPPGGAYSEATLVVFEVMPHVELVQPAADTARRALVVQGVVEHVVEQVPEEEPRCGRESGASAERADEEGEEPARRAGS